jgi:hypothetical protein
MGGFMTQGLVRSLIKQQNRGCLSVLFPLLGVFAHFY